MTRAFAGILGDMHTTLLRVTGDGTFYHPFKSSFSPFP